MHNTHLPEPKSGIAPFVLSAFPSVLACCNPSKLDLLANTLPTRRGVFSPLGGAIEKVEVDGGTRDSRGSAVVRCGMPFDCIGCLNDESSGAVADSSLEYWGCAAGKGSDWEPMIC